MYQAAGTSSVVNVYVDNGTFPTLTGVTALSTGTANVVESSDYSSYDVTGTLSNQLSYVSDYYDDCVISMNALASTTITYNINDPAIDITFTFSIVDCREIEAEDITMTVTYGNATAAEFLTFDEQTITIHSTNQYHEGVFIITINEEIEELTIYQNSFNLILMLLYTEEEPEDPEEPIEEEEEVFNFDPVV